MVGPYGLPGIVPGRRDPPVLVRPVSPAQEEGAQALRESPLAAGTRALASPARGGVAAACGGDGGVCSSPCGGGCRPATGEGDAKPVFLIAGATPHFFLITLLSLLSPCKQRRDLLQ